MAGPDRSVIRMHVMLCYSIYPPIQAGGAELIVAYLAEGLAARGHRVTVVTTCGPAMEPYPTEMRNGVEVVRFFPPNRYWLFDRQGRGGLDKLRWHLRDAWNTAAGQRLRAIIGERRPDVIHCHGVEGFSPVIWRIGRALGIPVVHTAHDYYVICPRALLLTRNLEICASPQLACRVRAAWYLRCARAIDLFCSPSQFLLDQHIAAGLPTPRRAVVPNGIPTVVHDRASREQPGGALRILFAGRLTPEKGVRVALQAMQHLPPSLGVELTIAGKGALEAEVRAACTADARIVYAGYLSGAEKERAFARADCLLLPSLWYENAPVVILEAAAYGLPVVGSRIGAIPEFVRDGVNGLLFETGNPADLARVLVRLAADASLRAALGTGGAPLLAKHSIPAMVAAYLSHYEDVQRARADPARSRVA
jgi:glycosyltransferase involved in cell wall biosynthesis